MAKITYVPCIPGTHKRICPFGERDLDNDECYSGGGRNRCKYFIRYDWDEHSGCVACTHPPINNEPTLFDL